MSRAHAASVTLRHSTNRNLFKLLSDNVESRALGHDIISTPYLWDLQSCYDKQRFQGTTVQKIDHQAGVAYI